MNLKQKILKEMVITEKDKIMFKIMEERPTLVNFYGEDKFKKKFNQVWKKHNLKER